MKCKVIRMSGYHFFAQTLEEKISEALNELKAHRIFNVHQSLAHGLSSGAAGKEEQLHALVTIFYEEKTP